MSIEGLRQLPVIELASLLIFELVMLLCFHFHPLGVVVLEGLYFGIEIAKAEHKSSRAE
ncbi:MAG: hypothetical protein H6773_04005 [Pseudomonadales bacterium]|nr:hypothetical protein [Pseudomonadales bacterium]